MGYWELAEVVVEVGGGGSGGNQIVYLQVSTLRHNNTLSNPQSPTCGHADNCVATFHEDMRDKYNKVHNNDFFFNIIKQIKPVVTKKNKQESDTNTIRLRSRSHLTNQTGIVH